MWVMTSKKVKRSKSIKRRARLPYGKVIDELIGIQVKLIRKSQNMTQVSLAERLQVSYQQVQKYEQGRNRIAASTLLYIAASLDRPIGDFFILADAFLSESKR